MALREERYMSDLLCDDPPASRSHVDLRLLLMDDYLLDKVPLIPIKAKHALDLASRLDFLIAD